MSLYVLLAVLVALIAGGLAGYIVRSTVLSKRAKVALDKADDILKQAEDQKRRAVPVSYTHLTLTTNRE